MILLRQRTMKYLDQYDSDRANVVRKMVKYLNQLEGILERGDINSPAEQSLLQIQERYLAQNLEALAYRKL